MLFYNLLFALVSSRTLPFIYNIQTITFDLLPIYFIILIFFHLSLMRAKISLSYFILKPNYFPNSPIIILHIICSLNNPLISSLRTLLIPILTQRYFHIFGNLTLMFS